MWAEQLVDYSLLGRQTMSNRLGRESGSRHHATDNDRCTNVLSTRYPLAHPIYKLLADNRLRYIRPAFSTPATST